MVIMVSSLFRALFAVFLFCYHFEKTYQKFALNVHLGLITYQLFFLQRNLLKQSQNIPMNMSIFPTDSDAIS